VKYRVDIIKKLKDRLLPNIFTGTHKNAKEYFKIEWDTIRCVYMYTLLEWYEKMLILNLCFLSYFRNRWGFIANGWFSQPDSDICSSSDCPHHLHIEKEKSEGN
jgi:hypothetical protein